MTRCLMDIITPAKSEAELMAYRKGYASGAAEGLRKGMSAAAIIVEQGGDANAIRASIPKRRDHVRGKKAW